MLLLLGEVELVELVALLSSLFNNRVGVERADIDIGIGDEEWDREGDGGEGGIDFKDIGIEDINLLLLLLVVVALLLLLLLLLLTIDCCLIF